MKTFLGYVLLLVPALMQAQVHTTTGLPFNPTHRGIADISKASTVKSIKALSPQAIAQALTEFDNKTIVEPYDLANSWHILHADMLEQRARDYRQMASNIANPKPYRMLARQTELLSKFMRRPLFNLTQDVQKSLKGMRSWMELRARQQELRAQQYAVMAKQTTNEHVRDTLNQMAAKCKHVAELMREALNSSQRAKQEQPTTAHVGTVEGTQFPSKNTE